MPAWRGTVELGASSSQHPASCVSGGVAAARVARQAEIPSFFVELELADVCSPRWSRIINNPNPGHVNWRGQNRPV